MRFLETYPPHQAEVTSIYQSFHIWHHMNFNTAEFL